ncbi:MAG: DUF4976 domain-containing protein [Desulfobacteraceae bacterium]|nr:DUF4976 domain-containing protein [Desulfobacteraceae bacterium]
MKLFSYIVKPDSGFSPNPFWGYCTLACCKPTIRRTAKPGDWIVGLSSKSQGYKIVYLMYDLQDDPSELKNVVNDPEYQSVQERLMDELSRHMTENLDRERLMEVLTAPSDGQHGMS